MRTSGDADVQTRVAPLSKALKRKLATIAELGPGILVEDKGYSLALHYRLAPEKGPAVLEAVGKICAEAPDEVVEILPGKLVVDIKARRDQQGRRRVRIDAALAVCRPASRSSSVTIRPMCPVFGIIPKFGGRAYSVGGIVADVDGHFATPETVREWLARIAADELGAAE